MCQEDYFLCFAILGVINIVDDTVSYYFMAANNTATYARYYVFGMMMIRNEGVPFLAKILAKNEPPKMTLVVTLLDDVSLQISSEKNIFRRI